MQVSTSDIGADAGALPTPTRAELEALQLERLRSTLRTAYQKVPHYRRAFDAAGVHPDDLASLGDLARFPFTTKDDLRVLSDRLENRPARFILGREAPKEFEPK